MASRRQGADNQNAIPMRILRLGLLVLTAVIGLAQTRPYRPPPPRPFSGSRAPTTASPDIIELGGPEWGFAHSNPTFLASFNLTELLKSPVGQWILSQMGRALSLNAVELDKLKMVLSEIDHISVSAQPKTARQMDGVVLLTGHFENQLLTKLIQISGGPAPRMLDSNTMLLGDSDSLEAAIQRISKSWNARRTEPLIQRARRLTMEHDFWITGPPPPELSAVLAPGGGIRSFTVGMSLGKQIRVVLALDTTTPQAADQILASYRKLETAGRRSPQLAAQWNEMSRSLRIERLSPGIQFSVADASPPPEVLLAQLAAIPMFQPPSSSNSVHAALAALDTSSAAAAKSVPVNRKIVILGADGSRELPVQ
jgi:hypothetical protein